MFAKSTNPLCIALHMLTTGQDSLLAAERIAIAIRPALQVFHRDLPDAEALPARRVQVRAGMSAAPFSTSGP